MEDFFCSYDEEDAMEYISVPNFLFKGTFKELSNGAKLLYGLMMERMSHSVQNGWVDEQKRLFIVYSADEIMQDINCSKQKANRLIKELTEIGLVEIKSEEVFESDIMYLKRPLK